MPYAIWYQEPVLHILCKFLWEGFLTLSSVFIRVKSFFDTPHAVWCGKFLFSFTCLVLVYLGSFSGTLTVSLSGEFLLHVLCCFKWGVCLTQPLLFYVGSFSYTPCCFMWGVSLPRPVLFYVGSFSYTSLAVLGGKFLLHAPCCFMWGVSLTRLLKVFLQAPHFCDQKADKPMQEQGVLGEVCVPCLRSSKCQLSSKWHGKWT